MKKIYSFIICSALMLGTLHSLAQITCLPFTFNFSTISASCSGTNDGSASVIVLGGVSPFTYQWDAMANNQTTDTAINLMVGNYSVIAADSLGCVDTGYVSITAAPLVTPSICMVSVDDESVNNIIYWDKTVYTNVDSFIVYREVSPLVYQQVGAVSNDSLSEFTDTSRLVGPANGDPNIASYRYKIAIRDHCGNYSLMSPYHNTIYITDAGAGQFDWSIPYSIEGSLNPVNNYVLMCDTANLNFWTPAAVVPGNASAATDPGFVNHSATAN